MSTALPSTSQRECNHFAMQCYAEQIWWGAKKVMPGIPAADDLEAVYERQAEESGKHLFINNLPKIEVTEENKEDRAALIAFLTNMFTPYGLVNTVQVSQSATQVVIKCNLQIIVKCNLFFHRLFKWDVSQSVNHRRMQRDQTSTGHLSYHYHEVLTRLTFSCV